MVSRGPIVGWTVKMRMHRIGSSDPGPITSQWSLLNKTVCTRMVRSGSGSEASSYDDIIVWAHLIQGRRLPMVSWGPIVGGTVKMQMPRIGSLESVLMVLFWPLLDGTVNTWMAHSGSFDSEALNADGIARTNCWWDSWANASYRVIRSSANGIVMVTS